MKKINHLGRETYCLDTDLTRAKITATGAHVMADFLLDGKPVNPYFIAPWWNEDCTALMDTCDYPLRGIFFGFPFGISQPQGDLKRPCHGFVPARDYTPISEEITAEGSKLTLSLDVPEENANVKQTVSVRNGETALYLETTITGAVGRYTVGYHPTLQIPTQLGNAILDQSPYVRCLTAPEHIDKPENGGYCSLLKDYELTDETCVPTVYGQNVNLKRHPFIKGFDDIYMYIFDRSHDFDYAAMSVPSEGYLYYQLKNPAQLANSMIWTSYCGRHYPKWNSRVNGCLEIGAGTNYFFYGQSDTLDNNPLTPQGFPMYHEFDGSARTYKLISGVVKIPADYQGVASIERKDEQTIVITGKDGSVIETACCVDFLA